MATEPIQIQKSEVVGVFDGNRSEEACAMLRGMLADVATWGSGWIERDGAYRVVRGVRRAGSAPVLRAVGGFVTAAPVEVLAALSSGVVDVADMARRELSRRTVTD